MPKLICLALFASALFAESPLVGTWKLDPTKSKYSTGNGPKNLTVVTEEKDGDLQITATGTAADGTPISVKFTVPEKGGAGKVLEGTAEYDGITAKPVTGNVLDTTTTKNGKEVATRHTVVSKDGKTVRSTVKGINAQGNPVSATEVFEKQ